MKLAMIIDANPKMMRSASTKVRLRKGPWTFITEGVVDSILYIYHTRLDVSPVQDNGFEKYVLNEALTLHGPAHCFIDIVSPGTEKKISVFAMQGE